MEVMARSLQMIVPNYLISTLDILGILHQRIWDQQLLL